MPQSASTTALTRQRWTRERSDGQRAVVAPNAPDSIVALCNTVSLDAPIWVSAPHADARAFAGLVISQVPAAGATVLDVGTGSGLLAICLAKLGYRVHATDVSALAVRTAQANARRHGVSFACYTSDLLENVSERFDVIAFNLPYNVVRDTFLGNIAKNILRRAPQLRRSTGGRMPAPVVRFHRKLLRRLLDAAPAHLSSGGMLILHVAESETTALERDLPNGVRTSYLTVPAMADNRTTAMVIAGLSDRDR